MAQLTMTHRSAGERVVADLVGEIDVYHAPRLRAFLEERIESGATDLVLNLTGIVYIDSTGLGVLVAVRKTAVARGGDVALICPDDKIRRIFQITGLHAVFAIHPDEPSALAESPVQSEPPG